MRGQYRPGGGGVCQRLNEKGPRWSSTGALFCLILDFDTGILKIVEFTEEKGLTQIYVNQKCRKMLSAMLNKVVEVCVEVVETLWIKGLTKNGMQDAGRKHPFLSRFRFYVLPK